MERVKTIDIGTRRKRRLKGHHRQGKRGKRPLVRRAWKEWYMRGKPKGLML